MGETEICGLGAKVCRLPAVDVPSKGDSTPVKAETRDAERSLSPSLSESSVPSPSNEPCSQKSYDCTECDRKFLKPSKLKNHMNLHTGERPFTCKHTGCDKAYTNSSHLLRHMKSHQGVAHPLQICVECKAMFRSAGGLQKHMKSIHMLRESEYPYSCKECGRAFRKKKLLAYHMQEHGGDPAFRCAHCNIQFTHKHLYNRHMRGHRTHPCRQPGCPVVLANWSLFRKHMALHNRESTIIEILSPSKRATAPDANENEGGLQHDPDPEPESIQVTVKVPGKKCPVCNVHVSVSRYYDHIEQQHKDILRCPHPNCDRVYTYKRNLDSHVRLHHTTAARFVCEICDRNLASKQKLKMHMINIHVNNGPKPYHRKSQEMVAPRKDKGTKKRALAAKLAGIEIPYLEEKRLLQKDFEFRCGDPLSAPQVVSSPDSGFFGVPASLRTKLNEGSDLGRSSEEGYGTGEVTDASDLQGPSETQRRNEEHQDTSSDEEYMFSGGDSSDEESGSGHCEDDDDEDADGDGDGDEDHDDDEGGDDDDEDLNEDEDEDEDEAEESNGHDEGHAGHAGEEQEGGHVAQGDGGNAKRPGSESPSPSRDEVQHGSGDFGVDRDSTIPSVESEENLESPEFITGDVGVGVRDESQRGVKRKADELGEEAKRQRVPEIGLPEMADADTTETGHADAYASAARDAHALLQPQPDKMQIDRNVDPGLLEVKIVREKVSKRLPEGVWVNNFQTSIDHCLPDSGSGSGTGTLVKEEQDSLSENPLNPLRK